MEFVNETNMNLSNECQRFLLFAVLGIDKDSKTKDRDCKRKCCERAYLDVCRTIKFKYNSDTLKKAKEGTDEYRYKEDKGTAIKAVNDYLISDNLIKGIGEENWHKNACDEVIKRFRKRTDEKDIGFQLNQNEGNLFFGQAQKWLNMSLKYMWLLGMIDSEKVKYLHFPVDNVILQACWEKKDIPTCAFPIKNESEKNCEQRKNWNETKIKSWSKWDWDQYNDFVNRIKECYTLKDKNWCPIEWENETWIRTSLSINSEKRNN